MKMDRIRIVESLTFEQATKELKTNPSLATRRMDEKHKSPKTGVPDTLHISIVEGELWRHHVGGGGRPCKMGKGRQQLWYTFDPTKPKAVGKTKPKAISRTKLRKKQDDDLGEL